MTQHFRLSGPNGSGELPDASPGEPPGPARGRAGRRAGMLRKVYKSRGLLVAGASGLSGVAVWYVPKHGNPLGIALISLAVGITAALVAMYREHQETRRTQIRNHPQDTVADALAGLIRAVHKEAAGGTPKQDAAEAERVRDSARQVLTEHGESLLAELTRMKAVGAREAGDEDR